jgi:hypothetical protein
MNSLGVWLRRRIAYLPDRCPGTVLTVRVEGRPLGSLVLQPVGKDTYDAELVKLNQAAIVRQAERPDVSEAPGPP